MARATYPLDSSSWSSGRASAKSVMPAPCSASVRSCCSAASIEKLCCLAVCSRIRGEVTRNCSSQLLAACYDGPAQLSTTQQLPTPPIWTFFHVGFIPLENEWQLLQCMQALHFCLASEVQASVRSEFVI